MRVRAYGVLAALAILTLDGCASPAVAPPSPPPVAAALVAPQPAPIAPAPPPDPCGAAELAGLVGQLRSDIPISVDLTRRRVVCSTCPMTQDVRADRQTILYDASTNRVTAVQCR